MTLLLPLFFAFTGLRTNIGLLDRPVLWLITLALIAVAIIGKLFGAMIAARITGFAWRPAALIGTLMNTRGLTELIVLNLALEKGVISEALFAMLVIMALVTTFMAGPALKLLDPNNEFGAPVEEELEEARKESVSEFPELAVPDRSILLAPQADGALAQLSRLAEPLARSEPPRELILAKLVRPPRGAAVRGGLQTENKILAEAAEDVTEKRNELIDNGIAARSVAFISAEPGADLSRLAESEEVDLLFIDGRRPLLGEGVPRGEVGAVLESAPCDVAVLVARENARVSAGPDAPIVVPFGGAEHDWAALELGAWMSSAVGAPLKMLGAAGETDEGLRITRLLGDAGLLVQQYAGITAEPLVAEPGREGIVQAAAGAGLLVVGLSERWREEGLGETRSEIAKALPAPVLFVRRGVRPGALAPTRGRHALHLVLTRCRARRARPGELARHFPFFGGDTMLPTVRISGSGVSSAMRSSAMPACERRLLPRPKLCAGRRGRRAGGGAAGPRAPPRRACGRSPAAGSRSCPRRSCRAWRRGTTSPPAGRARSPSRRRPGPPARWRAPRPRRP